MDSGAASTAGARVAARLVATVAVLFAALVLLAPALASAAPTSTPEASHQPANVLTAFAADQHIGTLRLDLPQLPSALPPLTTQTRSVPHTADTSSTTFASTVDSHRTRGPPPDDRS